MMPLRGTVWLCRASTRASGDLPGPCASRKPRNASRSCLRARRSLALPLRATVGPTRPLRVSAGLFGANIKTWCGPAMPLRELVCPTSSSVPRLGPPELLLRSERPRRASASICGGSFSLSKSWRGNAAPLRGTVWLCRASMRASEVIPGRCASTGPRFASGRRLRARRGLAVPLRATAPLGLCTSRWGPAVHSQGMVRPRRFFGGAPPGLSVPRRGSAGPPLRFCKARRGPAVP
jgi:hypothetical protein